MSVKVIAYYRVSTPRQGRSGLGLDAQRAAVRQFAENESLTILAEHVEIERFGYIVKSPVLEGLNRRLGGGMTGYYDERTARLLCE